MLNLNLCLFFKAMFVVISTPSASNILWLLGAKHPDPLEIQPCLLRWRTKITINLRGNLHHCGFVSLSPHSTAEMLNNFAIDSLSE